ncbi:S-adenosylmethionine decarboxylase [bacterium]|nr:S-adenosylmethionine decarboxylase [bacterium]
MMNKPEKPYGFELIMDLHDCDVSKFDRTSLHEYFNELCKAIDMKQCELYFWDDEGLPPEERQTSPHTKGTSAVQFILTSSVVVHTLDLLKAVYINLFSCKKFDKKVVERLTKEWFGAKECRTHFIERI